MQVKLYGQNICIKKLQALSPNFHKMLSILQKSRSIMETTILWVKCWPSMKCGIMICGWRKSKDPRPLFKLHLLSDTKPKRSFMSTLMSISCSWSEKRSAWTDKAFQFHKVQESFCSKKKSSKCTTTNFSTFWKNMKELSQKLNQFAKTCWHLTLTTWNSNSIQACQLLLGLQWTLTLTWTMSTRDWTNLSNWLSTSMISLKTESKTISDLFLKFLWFHYHTIMSHSLYKHLSPSRKSTSMKRETFWLLRTFRLKDQLMIYFWLLSTTHLIQELTVSKLKKSKESRDTISGICIMLSFMPLKILLMPWNTEFVDRKVEETASSIHSLRLMFNCPDNKSNSIHPYKKSKKPSTRQQLQSSDAARHFTIGINKTLKTTRNNLFMKWLLKIKKSSKSFCFWLVQFKEQRTKSMISSLNSINSNGCGKSPFQNRLKNSPKVPKSHNSQPMKLSLRNSHKPSKTLTKSNWLLLLEPCNSKPKI